MQKKSTVRIFILILLILNTLIKIQAQVNDSIDIFMRLSQPDEKTGARVVIEQPSYLENSFIKFIENQRKTSNTQGYRICIFSGTGQKARDNANQARARFLSKYEKIKIYNVFKFPFYKIYVGDFRTRSEAIKFLKQIEYDFPDAYIIPDIINPDYF